MKLKHIVASVSLLAVAGFAMADSGKSRAEVQAEVVQARAAGLLDTNDATFPVIPAVASTLTRAQVQAQVVQARAAGQLDTNEANYPASYPQPSVKKTQAN